MTKTFVEMKRFAMPLVIAFFFASGASAQFLDDFSTSSLAFDPDAITGWAFYTGDGFASVDFQQRNGYASIFVDVTKDKRNIWWALIRRRVLANFDLSLLSKAEYELQIFTR